MNIYEKLANIQQELKAPKNQRNKFGGYNFRSCEDILEAVKPLLEKYKLLLTIQDEIVTLGTGERYYIRATATVIDYEDKENPRFESIAYAREEENKKGMDLSQVTGATSSYARKYALNGLFCIDDTKDADTEEFSKVTKENSNILRKKVDVEKLKFISEAQRKRLFALGKGNNEAIKNVLARYGYEKTEEIKVEDYNKICTEIEAEVNM